MRFLIFLLLVAAKTSVEAREAPPVQNIAPKITSLNDKDAIAKVAVHPAFMNAGKTAGVEIWRIQNFEPVAVDAKDHGKFFIGDSYIVLKTKADKRNNLSWDIHFWIGSQSTQDESGAAAILSVGLDEKFHGAAIQHRETLGAESVLFKRYFPKGIKYLDGGTPSGFKHVVTNPGAEKRLLQVKGKKNVRVRQVDPQISSMNKGDCYILDVGDSVYVYVGEEARQVEKLKAISVANQIRDQDHNGRAKVEIIDQYSNEADIDKFFVALGSGAKGLVPESSTFGDDLAFEKSEENSVQLIELSERAGVFKRTHKQLRQENLNPQEAYILITASGSIYVWLGKNATQKEKNEAMRIAQHHIGTNYPLWVKVVRIPQGTEPAIFKQYFASWRDEGMVHSRII